MTLLRGKRILPDPKEYSTFIKQIELIDISLVSARVQNQGYPEVPSNPFVVNKEKAWYENGEGQFTVFHRYHLDIFDNKEKEGKRILAKIEVVFACTYKSPIPLADEIFNVFEKLNLRVNTWPYLREFVHNISLRMNWGKLIAPLYKVGK